MRRNGHANRRREVGTACGKLVSDSYCVRIEFLATPRDLTTGRGAILTEDSITRCEIYFVSKLTYCLYRMTLLVKH